MLLTAGFVGHTDGAASVAGLEEVDLPTLGLWLAAGFVVWAETSVVGLAVDLLLV